jgi:hypothetical protein
LTKSLAFKQISTQAGRRKSNFKSLASGRGKS